MAIDNKVHIVFNYDKPETVVLGSLEFANQVIECLAHAHWDGMDGSFKTYEAYRKVYWWRICTVDAIGEPGTITTIVDGLVVDRINCRASIHARVWRSAKGYRPYMYGDFFPNMISYVKLRTAILLRDIRRKGIG